MKKLTSVEMETKIFELEGLVSEQQKLLNEYGKRFLKLESWIVKLEWEEDNRSYSYNS